MKKAFFGKTMENVRDRTILDFIDHSQRDQITKRQLKLCFKGNVNHYSEFSVYKYEMDQYFSINQYIWVLVYWSCPNS